MSPVGTPIIAVSCHTVDGQGSHKAPGLTSEDRVWFKAECATSILAQMVTDREEKRRSALDSSQGQQAIPTILMVGDLNVNRDVFKRALQHMDEGDSETDCTLMAVNLKNLFAITDGKVEIPEGMPKS